MARGFVENRLLLAYAPSYPRCTKRGDYVSKILSVTKRADSPVECATRFELTVNLGTANALGLRFPEWLLPQATEAIRQTPSMPRDRPRGPSRAPPPG